MTVEDKVIIEVALNENQMRAVNPHVPYSPDEIAEAARQCYEAGAAVVHFHGREPETGRPLMSDPEVSLATQSKIAETTPLLAYPTYGSMSRVLDYYVIGDPAPTRFRHFQEGIAQGVDFEMGPVDLGAYDGNALPLADGKTMAATEGMLLNTGADQVWTARFCRENALKTTFALFDTRHVRNLRNVIDWGLAGEAPYVAKLFMNGFGASLDSELRLLDHYLEEMRELLPGPFTWMPVLPGADQFPLAAVAIARGGHVRVGLGDHHYGEAGAPTNAALVERAVQLVRAIGREPATPDEAREIWGIKPRASAKRPAAQTPAVAAG